MNYIISIKESSKYINQKVGGKGFSLINLVEGNFLVPDGFILLSDAYFSFLEYNNLKNEILNTINKMNFSSIENIVEMSLNVKSLFQKAEFPIGIANEVIKEYSNHKFNLVAIRSSASIEDGEHNSWAGKLDTFLNSNETQLLINIKKCWASLFSERAIRYGLNKGINFADVGVSVIIQKMIPSKSSGVVFTTHPTGRNKNVVVIEAAFGLGELMMSSKMTPDYYEIDKVKETIIKKIIVNKKISLNYSSDKNENVIKNLSKKISLSQVLKEREILELSKIAVKIEHYFKQPQDIEWCFYKNKFFILQSRPITTSTQRFESKFDPSEFKKIYASKGLPFLYEDLISKNYIKWNNLIFCIDGGDYVFANIKSLENTKEIGCVKTVDEILTTIKILEEKINLCIELDSAVEVFDRTNAKKCILFFQEILNHYGYLDHCYWDKVFSQVESNNISKKKIELVTTFKNSIREKLNQIFFREDALFQRLVRNLGEIHNVTPKDIFWYTSEELIKLFDHKVVCSKIIQERKICALFININGITKISQGYKAYQDCQVFITVSSRNIRILKGIVANNNGIINGYVKRIVRDYDNFELTRTNIATMNKGEILVTETTDPELDEAINKASGILTEIGGMLSHAAISARELNIPCIVGIDNLTQILKNGDFVELNSITGKVTLKLRPE